MQKKNILDKSLPQSASVNDKKKILRQNNVIEHEHYCLLQETSI